MEGSRTTNDSSTRFASAQLFISLDLSLTLSGKLRVRLSYYGKMIYGIFRGLFVSLLL